MIGIIGKKLGMTQIFNEQGQQIPCTVVEATPNAVTQILTAEAAGVSSVQLGYGEQKLSRENKKGEKTPRGRRAHKAVVGHAAKAGLSTAPKLLRSFRRVGRVNVTHRHNITVVGSIDRVALALAAAAN